MSRPIIEVRGVSKRYQLGRIGFTSLRAEIERWWSRGRNGAPPADAPEDFWALRDVSFDVQPGEVIGIIGRNGAGKSTLLKILSEITEPTEGEVRLRGRTASLLEVGTGFHPELSGRENIFLNGAILGMRRAEIARKFDEIVAFAEVEQFIDTPVKRYSSGMYVRLAFAVAAHLEPEILIVDEVLAVGDMAFQRKCLGKMESVAKREGRTVLFVSHNMTAVQRFCSECNLLEAGRLAAAGKPALIVEKYLDISQEQLQSGQPAASGKQCSVYLQVCDEAGTPTRTWQYDRSLRFEVTIEATRPLKRVAVDISFYADRKTRLFSLRSDQLTQSPPLVEGRWVVRFDIRNPGLTLGDIFFDIGVREGNDHHFELICNAGKLTTDCSAIPQALVPDCILHPHAAATWHASTPSNENIP